MFVEAVVLVVVLFIYWYVNFRPRSTNQLRPSYQSHHSTSSVPASDYVVIGGGAAGLAAAAELLRRTSEACHIVLIESGGDPQPASSAALLFEAGRRDRLLSFAPDLVRVPLEARLKGMHPTFLGGTPDEGYVAQRPCHFFQAEEALVAAPARAGGTTLAAAARKANRYLLLQYAPYPRGVGLGGTAQLDWGMHVNSLWPVTDEAVPGAENASSRTAQSSCEALPQWTRLPVRFPAVRNPLSWAFAEAAKALKLAAPYLPTTAVPVKRGVVFPCYLYLDEDGRRLALPSALLGDIATDTLHRRLSVLTGHTAVNVDVATQDGGESEERGVRVTGVQVRPSHGDAGAIVSIPVGKGVVVAAGALHSPRLLHKMAKHPALRVRKPPPSTVPVRDALALPLIFSAVPAVSADSFNARNARSTAMWWLTQRGPYLTPLCDTLLSLPLPHIAPQAELRVILFPFGGRDAARFKGMGWDTVLGTPLQAFTMLLIVHGIDGLEHAVALDTKASPPGAAHVRALCSHQAVCPLSEEVHRQVQNAFLAGIKECRRLSETPPLANLTLEPGVESTDFTLLVASDEAKAVRLAQLSRLPPSKHSARGKVELKELREWSRRVAATETYMRRYADAHAYWLGFASGSSETFLASSSSASCSSRVTGLRNVFVGDSSAVTTAEWSDVGKRDTLAAGSRSTSMDAAVRAATELVKSCGDG
ncbi:conserved hypothetical protein [Leishmania major strain Friedlin]|uniref:Glucose-methanol-choline oxidoreductase N-terminal domain-containing protein n=1 Tax=Leishmania major TaxID=5664 RepID=Q4Q5I9_LEIMA|nr:conserved hypothetical protein [Leishmania major strain Friedlin]CAG9580113.1 FAD_dependent_oxidoreductase_-_putative [Leishmania major strain Friedlin]CAJ08613.1 conserved hypothetical protein [Leishmania major strain Friedlin]|eukprot:XP_001685409.1 conserved hypothetical protein [Leishmania major strain Friedlin]